MRRSCNLRQADQRGFTVIEMLIATVAFTSVLMLITTGVIHFSNQYYKAVNANATQNLVRTISEEITQSLQFSGGKVANQLPAPNATNLATQCVGTKKYIFRPAVAYDGEATERTNPGLYVVPWDSDVDGACDKPAGALPGGGKQLLQGNMRLTQFTIIEDVAAGPEMYTVALRIAYGDNDLLCSPTVGNCDTGFNGNNVPIANNGSDINCRTTTGSQFCAVSNINATVVSRVAGP